MPTTVPSVKRLLDSAKIVSSTLCLEMSLKRSSLLGEMGPSLRNPMVE